MTLLLAAFLVGFTLLTICVLTDSGLRLVSAAGDLASQRKALGANLAAPLPGKRQPCTARGAVARVSCARAAPLRAAA